MMLKMKMREGMERDIIGKWMEKGRELSMENEGEIGINKEKRIKEDERNMEEK